MTGEELDQARADEAFHLWIRQDNPKTFSDAVIAARLAREGWTPPPPVDSDVLVVREVLAAAEVPSSTISKQFREGGLDHTPTFQAALAAFRLARMRTAFGALNILPKNSDCM